MTSANPALCTPGSNSTVPSASSMSNQYQDGLKPHQMDSTAALAAANLLSRPLESFYAAMAAASNAQNTVMDANNNVQLNQLNNSLLNGNQLAAAAALVALRGTMQPSNQSAPSPNAYNLDLQCRLNMVELAAAAQAAQSLGQHNPHNFHSQIHQYHQQSK